MNKAIIESIEWHKDQLFKLLEDDDLYKIEGDIHSVKTDLNEIIEKAKAKKRVWVKATATKKGHYREMEVGREEKVGGAKVKGGSKEFSDAFRSVDALREATIRAQDKQISMVGEVRRSVEKAKNMKVSSIEGQIARQNAIKKEESDGERKINDLKDKKLDLSKKRSVEEKRFVATAFKSGDFGNFNDLSGKLVNYHGSTYRAGEIDKPSGVIRLYSPANVNEHNLTLYDFNLFINPASSVGAKEFESKKIREGF